jgi:hypothetical protein
MKRQAWLLATVLLLPWLFLFPGAKAEVHPATESPSGRYRLASEPALQQTPGSSNGHLGAVISLVGRDGAVLSKCYTPLENYVAGPVPEGRENRKTKAYWNPDETMVAVYSGGNIWSRVDFYSITQERIAILPHPHWQFSLFKDLKEYTGTNTRLFESFVKWTGKDTCEMNISGNAVLKESQPDPYPLFDYHVTFRISVDGIRIIEIKRNGND